MSEQPSGGVDDDRWSTHRVFNQVPESTGHDPWACDPALRAAVERAGAGWAAAALQDYAARIGNADAYALAAEANRQAPVFLPFDARGHRVDRVQFAPAWHTLLGWLRAAGWATRPFEDARPGRWAAWAAGFYLHGQVEQGTLCPATMTVAAIPLLRREPACWRQIGAAILSRTHDPSDQPLSTKDSAWVGMGMTEKQGGSDVRSNATVAVPDGGAYRLRGHKWFYSAPTSDAHLVTARLDADGAIGCFYVPRWRPDGRRNGVAIQRLKDKLGNRSNASGEVEFQDAWALPLGPADRGIATILEMATTTRLCCVLGSAAILRQATVQAIAYARRRQAFGRALIAHALMRSVLLDLALESEAAMVLGLRLASAFERAADDPLERAWQRILTPAAKFWVCKRTVECTAEAMEVLGGNGYVEESMMPRLLREAPVNSIWEGSGNVMCLDVLRAVGRTPDIARNLLLDLREAIEGDPPARAAWDTLATALAAEPADWEPRARWMAQQWVMLAQAALLRRHAPAAVADAFIATRLGETGWVLGALDPRRLAVDAVLDRAFAG